MRFRRLTAAGIAINFLLLCGLLVHRQPASAQSVPAVTPMLRAQAIELVDQRGQIRAQLSVESNGETILRMRDADGTIRVKLGASKEGSGLVLLDASTEPGLHLLARPTGSSLTVKHGNQQRIVRP